MITKQLKTPRVVRVLDRGNWMDESGEVVEPAIPIFLGSLGTSDRATRADLARWLVVPVVEGWCWRIYSAGDCQQDMVNFFWCWTLSIRK